MGGANLGGSYIKYEKPLDKTQTDKRAYVKTLFYGNNRFFIESIDNKLTIKAYDLKYSKVPFVHDIKGKVVLVK